MIFKEPKVPLNVTLENSEHNEEPLTDELDCDQYGHEFDGEASCNICYISISEAYCDNYDEGER